MAVEKYDRSVKVLTSLIESDSGNANAYRKLAENYYLNNDINSGLSYFNQLAEKKIGNLWVHYGRGYLYQKFNQNEKAAIEYQKIITLIPQYASFYKDFIDNYEQNKELNKADSILNNLAAKNSGDPYINYGLGYLFMKQNNNEKAIAFLDKTLALQHDFPDAYLLKGFIFFNMGQYDHYLEVSKTGLEKSKTAKDMQYQCIFLGNIGLSLCYTGNNKEAELYLKEAIKLSEKTGQKQEENRSIGNLGLVYRITGDYEKSLKFTEKALKGAQQIKDRNREGLYNNNIGLVYHMMGKYAMALEYNVKALSIANETGDKTIQSYALLNLGIIYWNLGDYNNALKYYNLMLEMALKTGNRWAEGRYYCGIGLISFHHGNFTQALDYDEKGLAIAIEIGDSEGETLILGNIAIIYNEIGNYTKALDYYTRALKVSEKIGDKSGIARHLGNIGGTYRILGNYPAAMDYFQQSLKIHKEIGDLKDIASAYGNMGALMVRMKEYKKAEVYLSQALKISREIGVKGIIAYQLISSGYLEYYQANYKASRESFSEALKYAKSTGELAIYWQAHTGMAMVFEKQNKPEPALEHYIAAIEKIEKVQRELSVEEFKSDFFGEHIDVYEGVIALLASMHEQFPQKNFDKLAFNFAERAKARAFLENLIASRANLQSGIDPKLKQKEDEILQKISVNQKQLYNKELTKKDRKTLELELNDYEDAFGKITREIKAKNTKYTNLYYPESYDAAKIQHEILQDDDVILEFSLGNERSFLWLLSKDNFKLFKLPGREIIEKAVQEYMNTIEQPVGVSNPFSNHVSKGYHVFEMLLKQCTQEINKGNHIIIVADGILHYLPFESLVIVKDMAIESPHYLIADYTFSYSPSSTSIAYFNENRFNNPSQKFLLAFGNPDFDEYSAASSTRGRSNSAQKLHILPEGEAGEKLKSLYENDGFHFTSLPYSGTEVSAIAGLFPKESAEIYLKSDASEESFKNEVLENYKYIHFATHGFIEESLPFRSGILLSTNEESKEDGILQVNEILNLKLNADMVALSACQTARGKLYRGEGIVGLARAFFYAGSSSVTVCLWNINDRTTAGFMKDFYSGLVDGKDKKDALQQAKLNMIRSEIAAYRHPYYWAPYIAIGNYR
ncbi:MAG: tetratricopeptide repeat protein [Bacteroidales bacterium]|nr:tetratricopeptide repeat protein [Bacteroidales bacterium]